MTHKSMLSDFYGLSSSAGDDEVAAAPVVKVDERTTLTSQEFDTQCYLNSLLPASNMSDLIKQDNSMISSKRALDSEMQTLVYENYNKFISATDMIRSMKSNVEGMELQMKSLQENMHGIHTDCTGIEGDFRPNREKVDNLLGVSRLLKRLEFLFELPGRLERSISLGAFEQAVSYFNISSRILANYQNMQSFVDIQIKSEGIMEGLKKQLRAAVLQQQPLAGAAGGAPLSSERQMSYVAMLVCDLRESESSAKELLGHVVAQQRAKSTQGMQRALDLAAAASTNTQAATNARKASMDAAPLALLASAAASSSSSSSPSALVASGPSLLSLLHQHFLNPFILFADTFLDTLVRPYEAKLTKLKQQQSAAAVATAAAVGTASPPTTTTAKAGAGDRFAEDILHLTRSLALTNSSLLSLTSDLFVAYFNLVKAELLRFATIRPSRVAGAGFDAVVGGAAGGDEDAARSILNFTGALKDFYGGLSRPMSLVPRAGLDDRATELMQKAILGCVENICDKVLCNIVQTLSDCHTQVVEFSSPSSSSGQKTVLPSPAVLSTTLRKSVEEGVSLLVVVLSTREYLPEGLPFPNFNDLAHAHFHQLLTQLVNILRYRTARKSDGPIFDALPQTKLSQAINEKVASSAAAGSGAGGRFTVRDAHAPLFYLYLSQICSAQESKDILASLKTLRKFFPLASVAPPSSSSFSSARSGRPSQQQQQQADREAFLQDLLAQTKENSQALLMRFSETHGFIASNIVRVHMLAHAPASGEILDPSSFVDHLQSHFARVTSELALIFREDGSSSHSRGESSQINTSAGGRGGGGNNNPNGGNGGNGGGGAGINRDIARLFTQKTATFLGVEVEGSPAGAQRLAPNRTQPMAAIAKIVFKAMVETVRMERVTASMFHQLQLDVFALRRELSSSLPDADGEVFRDLFGLLDEALNSAQERAPGNFQPIDDRSLGDMYDASRNQRPSNKLNAQQQQLQRDAPQAASAAAATQPQDAAQDTKARRSSSGKADAAPPTGALARLVLSDKSAANTGR